MYDKNINPNQLEFYIELKDCVFNKFFRWFGLSDKDDYKINYEKNLEYFLFFTNKLKTDLFKININTGYTVMKSIGGSSYLNHYLVKSFIKMEIRNG